LEPQLLITLLKIKVLLNFGTPTSYFTFKNEGSLEPQLLITLKNEGSLELWNINFLLRTIFSFIGFLRDEKVLDVSL